MNKIDTKKMVERQYPSGECTDEWCCMHGKECQKLYKHGKTCYEHFKRGSLAELTGVGESYVASYAWVRNAATFDELEPNPDETLCGWCKKSQTQILNEHIEAHDQPEPQKTDWEERFDRFVNQDKYITPFELKDFIRQERLAAKREVLDSIDPFHLVEDCHPDCTPEEHAYHQGTWDSYLKLERILNDLR